MKRVVFVTGGARSGKSSFALNLALGFQSRVFLATAQAFDSEMEERIQKHRDERGTGFTTVEEPISLSHALLQVPSDTEVVLVDCLTVWTGNLMHRFGEQAEEIIERETASLIGVLQNPPCSIILVSNEVGMGIVPENAMARKFRDLAGIVNQKVAATATEAYLLCSGLPIQLT
ncbi:MAG: bifunctional adenosylcobinamide kinase/adenosylcobinamide-phosphate guanylyltransferase [Chlorobium sp.]|nr:bifunctional adenosylcobinamide kinase/adenosylcobinamide-phosphate guanylyltransferase [Chlorobium phaeovibrioides]NQU46631.1 bifunctional adenosylcobinamide kinase/adenosylcobinamide-phosphate guanylyltransferase [Chlorobium sp.]